MARTLRLHDRKRKRTTKVGEQPPLFDLPGTGNLREKEPQEKPSHSGVKSQKAARRPAARPRTGLFGKSMLRDAVEFLPQLPETESLEEVVEFLRERLHYSAETTRHRNANYIVKRMFPDGSYGSSLVAFARLLPNTQELRDVCFYRFCKAEPLMYDVIESVVRPALARGSVPRREIRDYLARSFPSSKSIKDCAQAIADVLMEANVAHGSKTELRVGQRHILPPVLAFILHSEFTEPAMYDIGLLEANPAIRAMLWEYDGLTPALYELRNQGFLPKVSEIDTIRQFTVNMSLEEVVAHLAKLRTKGAQVTEGYSS